MSQGLLDTSVIIARESGRPHDRRAMPDQLSVSVITIGELRAGVLTATDAGTRELRLVTLEWALKLGPIAIDDNVASHWARLRMLLRDAGKRIPVNDSWIAATALALDIPVVTQDGDYPTLPGLSVIRV